MALEILVRAISWKKKGKERKDIKVRKEEEKLTLFVDDMILHIENVKSSKNLLN